MGFKRVTVKMPPDYSEQYLQHHLGRLLGLRRFTFQIEKKSLDARKKNRIHWLLTIGVSSDEIPGETADAAPTLEIPYRKRNKKIVVVGSGPAGFFSALVLQKAGFETIILERGTEVKQRAADIAAFESSGAFSDRGNYAFGEGGAGTFSDGKLTARSKRISVEKQFILDCYVQAGAPPEIQYLNHPHLGSDNLRKMVGNLRREYQDLGGSIQFETLLSDLEIKNGTVSSAITVDEIIRADYFIIAPGHSAYETYRMLIGHGVPFRPKNFAIGSRVEHEQNLINRAQWGVENLPGVKAAEYRLTSNIPGNRAVYTFCMCPGGQVVPATAYANANIVNGMSYYRRNARFANAACVASVNPLQLIGESVSALDTLAWLENLEQRFYEFTRGYAAPFCRIRDFIEMKESDTNAETSYPLGLQAATLWQLLPEAVSQSLRAGLLEFNQKIKGYDSGIILGLESKTSAPIQAVREADRSSSGFPNLYLAGEGSGHAGGIISSAVDGIRTALSIIEANR